MPPSQTGSQGAPLRVLVDFTRLCAGGIGGGIKPALFEIVRWLGRAGSPPMEFVYLTNRETRDEVEGLARAGDSVLPAAESPPDIAARQECGVTYCPFGFTDWACPGVPTVTLIVDLLHRDFPTSLSGEFQRIREEAMRETLGRTDLFQVISDYTGGRLQRHYGIPPDRIVRTYLPIHERLPATATPAGRRKMFFYPANHWAHKNHDTLLDAFARYRKATTAEPWSLVLCGFHGEAGERWKTEAARLGVASAVEILGYVDDRRLAELWGEAGALVFPSLHEGFGVPVLEAMYHGVPVIADNSTVIPEITDGAALLLNARDPAKLAAGMRSIAEDEGLRARLAVSGRKRAAQFRADTEFGRLAQGLVATAKAQARFRRSGYHPIDGLIDPLALFALPRADAGSELSFAFAPLGIARTVEVSTGPESLTRLIVPANKSLEGVVRIPAGTRTLCLRVPDASKLSATDPRTHGTLVRTLRIATGPGTVVDLLG